MKEICTIKSSPHGLTLVLDEEVDFKTLILEVCTKFAESKDFFGKTNLILKVEGRNLSGDEMAGLIEAIEINSLIHVVLIEEDNKLKDARMVKMTDRFYFDQFYENAKISPGSVNKDETARSDGSILILGDVKKGGTVEAKGNIIVCGEIKGSAHAGVPHEEKAYVVANSFDTTSISIACLSVEIFSAKRNFFRRPSPAQPAVVVLWEGALLKESLSGGVIKKLLER